VYNVTPTPILIEYDVYGRLYLVLNIFNIAYKLKQSETKVLNVAKLDVVPVARLEAFRARLESFTALNLYSQI
jgi:hypothetical protein